MKTTTLALSALLAVSLTACGSDKPLTGDALCRSVSYDALATTPGCADFLQRMSANGEDCDREDFESREDDCGFPEKDKKKKPSSKPKPKTSKK